MKKTLSLVQIVILIAAALLPMGNQMFQYHYLTWELSSEPKNSVMDLSLRNLVEVQRFAPPFLFKLFCVLVMATLVYLVISLFFCKLTDGRRYLAAVPAVTSVVGALMVILVNSHLEKTNTTNEAGHTILEQIYATMGALGYLELILLAALVVIEVYKQYRC